MICILSIFEPSHKKTDLCIVQFVVLQPLNRIRDVALCLTLPVVPYNELPRDKTNKIDCAPSEDSGQPWHLPSLIRVFAVH